MKILQKEALENEAKAKFEKHLNELSLLMRCRNNPLCNETTPCDNCDKFIKTFKKDLNSRYLRQRADKKGNDLKNDNPEESCFGKSEYHQQEAKCLKIRPSSQGGRVTRFSNKGKIE